MNRDTVITDYVLNYDLDIEKMIMDFKEYILTIVNNSDRKNLTYEDKEEIISDVFLSVWHNKKRIDNTKPLKNYIAGITKNLISNKCKKVKNFDSDIYVDSEENVDLKNIELVYEQDLINQVITEELNNMKKRDYKIFCKYYYLSKSIKEISNEMCISETNVKFIMHRIRKKLKANLTRKGIVFKIMPIVLIVCFITGSTFAKPIIDFISVKFFNNVSEGVETAIENGYVQKVDMEYENDNDIGIKVDYIFMDDFYLNILFNIDLQEINNLSSIDFDSLVITDENKNLLLTKFDDRNKYLQFCRENDIENTLNNISLGNFNNSTTTYDYKNSNYICSYIIRSDNFPKSKKITISFDQITLLGKKREVIDTIFGKWKIDIELGEEMYNRETLIYDLEYCNDENLELISASVSETGLKIKCQTIWGDPVYSNEDLPEEIERKKNEFYNRPYSINDSLIKNEYVLNEDGKIFYPAHSNDGDGGYGKLFNGSLVYWQTFDLTRINATENLTIVLYKGGEWQKENGEEIIIKLLRKQ